MDVLRANCQGCHGDPPAFGAPMPLVDFADLHVPAVTDPTRKVLEMVAERVVDEAKPMPPTTGMEASDRDVLLQWIAAGAPEDPTADCGEVDDGGEDTGDAALPCEPDLVLTAHANASAEKFQVPSVGADNLYMCFAFEAPFDVPTQATAWAPIIDDERVVHHWILYRTTAAQIEGAASPCDVTLQLSTEFVAGWAPGGGNVVMPDDVGLELGGPGDWYLLQVHYNNTAQYTDALDQSGVAFCTTDTPREKTAGILSLGSIGISIPAGAEDHQVQGTCTGFSTFFWPELHLMGASAHMHELGRAMRTDVHHLDGATETVLDVPAFDFDSQGMYMLDPEIVVKPGDTLTTTCTYDNPNAWPVFFGEGTNDEMCFDFVLAYPIDALPSRNCGIAPGA
ncbi:MAG TPA: hypothetical protein VFG69_10005 [Nannocystaceae bacterium]|nr:hypothetical protein [Nannocystaceae bacterium]